MSLIGKGGEEIDEADAVIVDDTAAAGGKR